ncbi:MAG TPA: regulatory signaling modulator protein AmpE [Gammaproteobacteria bacterium]|nr:regulatory signaling modulator protein AmpE [Gammaproteobacteria bacterium]
MNFLAVLLALLLDQGLRHLESVRSARWFRAYSEALLAFSRSNERLRATSGALLTVMVPAVVVLFLDGLLTHPHTQFWDVLGLVFDVAVFWFCLGPQDLHTQAEAYIEASQAGDEARAAAAAGALLETTAPASASERTQAVIRAVLKEANARTFGVLFWFGLLGPAGAVLYRCADLQQRMPRKDESQEFQDAAERLLGVLAWLPAHLTALGYALAGSFEDAVSDLKGYYHDCKLQFFQVSDDVLVFGGLGAIRGTAGEDAGISRLKSALGLVRRTLLIWLVIYALITLFGWSW